MKYSIICPLYNNEKYIVECIQSILNQSFGDWELIIVDDGSTDGSFLICEEYKKRDARIKLFKQLNSGPSRARVNGISKATGDYVCFLDSDDLLESNMLEKLDYYIKKFSPDCVLFKTYRFRNVGEKNDAHPDRNLSIELLVGKDEIRNKCFFETIYRGLQQDCYRREVVSGIECPKEFDKLRFSEDSLYTYLFLSRCDSVLKIPDFLYGYRINPSGTTFHINENDIIGNWLIMKYIYGSLLFSDDNGTKIESCEFANWLYGDLFEYIWVLVKSKNNSGVITSLRDDHLVNYILKNKKRVSKPLRIRFFMWLFKHRKYKLMFFMKRIRSGNN